MLVVKNVCAWHDVAPVGERFLQIDHRLNESSLDRLLDDVLYDDQRSQRFTDSPSGEQLGNSVQDHDGDLPNETDDGFLLDQDDVEFLRSLDPRQWLKQDHYRVLGLSQMRHRATEQHIRRAYRLMVLRHHPDKRPGGRQAGVDVDDDYFTCITRAYETLSDRTRRLSFDSVDPTFDDSIPDKPTSDTTSFFSTFDPVFERNSRWSTTPISQVPQLGTADSPREHVENFYRFWFDLQSWREFSYGDDEESRERGDNRDERRFMEKQIRAQRRERKRAESARIRQLVETAYSCDPRVLAFKQEDRERKQAVKQRRADERKRKLQEQQELAEKAEAEAREHEEQAALERRRAADEARERRDAEKRRLAVGRQQLRRLCLEADYYSDGDSRQRADHMMQLERLCTMLDAVQLNALCEGLSEENTGEAPRTVFLRHVKDVQQRIINETRSQTCRTAEASHEPASSAGSAAWSHDELQTLIKAVRVFPAGTARRWQVVAEFISQHVSGSRRSAKEVLQRAKQLQHSDGELKSSATEHALRSHVPAPAVDGASSIAVNGGISERISSSEHSGGQLPRQQSAEQTPVWTAEEQRLLEQALKTYGANTADRWDRVAECLPRRTRRECMLRYKHLVEMVKAKKAAQAAAAAAVSHNSSR